MAWQPEITAPLQTEETKTYNHGFTEEEVHKIKADFEQLQIKVADGYEVTLDEFAKIVVPHCRIHRTEQFNLNKLKEKPKKEPKPKKPKKVTQKELKEYEKLVQKTIMLKASGGILSEEDSLRFEELKERIQQEQNFD